MEPQKRARYSKLLNAEELEEILMEEESYEELEDINDFIEPRENMSSSSSSSSSSSDKEAEEMEIRFRDRRPGDLPKCVLNEHQFIQSECPFPCDIDNKSFTRSSRLKRYRHIHAAARSFSCDVSNKTFSRQGHLKELQRLHSGEPPYSCD
ncbi:zinc finger and SCAN domain-containing protein 31-like, partial [Cryptotermes secundus]|uniref:zinc finger and SCAN domain-containing protein 31-like n=1 Tax=Cryptotermes secundus TaxID=105785 RepID=UPI000CD7CAA3